MRESAGLGRRSLRVVGLGDSVGLAGMLYRGGPPETTIALTPIRALAAGPAQFRELVRRARVRRRLSAAAVEQLRARRLFKAR